MSTKHKSKIKSTLQLILKLALVGGLLYFLTQRGFLSLEKTRQAFEHPDLLLPAFGALLVTMLFGVIRWQWLLQAQGIHLKWSRTMQLTFIGNFFNIALPGAVSGDFVKAFYVAKEVQGKKAPGFGSILFDRVAGVSALALVSAVAMIMDYGQLAGTPLFSAIKFMVILAAVCVIAFYTYLFLVREHHDPVLMVCKKLQTRFAKAEPITRIYESLRHYHHHRWTVLKALAISVVIHATVCFACIQFAHALGDSDISKFAVFVVVPLGLLVTAIPIMPAGIGTGHVAFTWLFHLLGSERGADVFTLFAMSQLLSGAIGGLTYLRFRSHEPGVVSLEAMEQA